MENTPFHLIVALGNPGAEHRHDRHNAGFMVGEELRRRHDLPAPRARFRGLYTEGSVACSRVALLFPTTFMNLSGTSVVEAVRWHRVPVERILVIHDEVELPFGEVRMKEGQGLGGHNGLRSLERSLRTRDFWRIRVGVGRPASASEPLVDYVLRSFAESREDVSSLIARAADLCEEWLRARGGYQCLA